MSLNSPQRLSNSHATAGVFMAIGAYGWWAVVAPFYYRAVDSVPVGELLAWRVVAGLPILCLLLWGTGRMRECWAIFRQPRVLGILSISAVLIAINWVVFVWSVVDNRLSEASLGYYICPLFIVALGMVVLGERMRWQQWVAVLCAAIGVSVLAWRIGGVPWISLTLAGSFGLYGLIRKQVDAAPAPGLAIEMLLLLPFMFGLLWFDHVRTGNAFVAGPCCVFAPSGTARASGGRYLRPPKNTRGESARDSFRSRRCLLGANAPITHRHACGTRRWISLHSPSCSHSGMRTPHASS